MSEPIDTAPVQPSLFDGLPGAAHRPRAVDTYAEAHRYDGVALHHDRRAKVFACAVQPRDVQVVRDVWRYKFLTAPQLGELWWPDAGAAWPMQRRLRKLFDAGLLERFRPLARRGSYPWTYHLGERGHALLRDAGLIDVKQRHHPRVVYDYGHVLHEIQLNAWVLALRRTLGGRLVGWGGERDIHPPPGSRDQDRRLSGDWSCEGLVDAHPKLIRPDAILQVTRVEDPADVDVFLIEFDRTRRVDKNFEKFRRYDTFLTWWWNLLPAAHDVDVPFVVFICQDAAQRELFVQVADRQLTGHHWHPSAGPERDDYVGRRQMLFCAEPDMHRGELEAWRLPAVPRRHPQRQGGVRQVILSPITADGAAARSVSVPWWSLGGGGEAEGRR